MNAPALRSRANRSVPRWSRSSTEFPAMIDTENDLPYAITGTGLVGATPARLFAVKILPVVSANLRGPEILGELTAELGVGVKAVTIEGSCRGRHHPRRRRIGCFRGHRPGAAGLVGQDRHRRDERLHAAAGGAAGGIPGALRIRGKRRACSGRNRSRPSTSYRSRFPPAHCPMMSIEGSCSSRATMRMRVRPP